MKVAYFDCFAGASGDMILGALMDAGLDLEVLKGEIAKLGLTHYDIQLKEVTKRGIRGSQAQVTVDEDHHHHHHRHLHHIQEIIQSSDLCETAKELSLKVFTRLAEAEARVHGTTIEHIHFHEVGAMDAIIDVVGAAVGLTAMGIERIYCSPLHVGAGTVQCAHGTLPVPAPATAELIKGRPVYSTGVQGELLTPTGAAILTTLAAEFGPMPAFTIERIGYGAGVSDPSIANVLRVLVGEQPEEIPGYLTERVAVLETNIDDMNPQMYDYVIEKLLLMGALDVLLFPVQMKKNRPAVQVKVICPPDLIAAISDFLIRETTTIGLRWRIENRIKADRSVKEWTTEYGPMRFKVARIGEKVINVTPEYDDCKQVALEHNIPLKHVMEAARIVAAAAKTAGCVP
ncbi:MAG: nickel pincer cofactor biosynthesis protein LarC [Thermodesulfobacteriota bacterium]